MSHNVVGFCQIKMGTEVSAVNSEQAVVQFGSRMSAAIAEIGFGVRVNGQRAWVRMIGGVWVETAKPTKLQTSEILNKFGLGFITDNFHEACIYDHPFQSPEFSHVTVTDADLETLRALGIDPEVTP